MAKWDNMLAILWMLRDGRKRTAAQIAESLEISVRTAYRYIDALCASGVPVIAESGHDGGFRLAESFRSAPLFFSATELQALVDAFKFAEGAGYPYTEELESALRKIEAGLNEEQIRELQQLSAGLDVISPARPPSVMPMLKELEQAVKEGTTLRIAYRKANEEEASEREIDPYGLAYDRSVWYVIAHCRKSDAPRTFRVDRIESVTRTDRHFQKPESFSPAEFLREMSDRRREADGPDALIVLEGETEVLDAACSHWHLRHYLKERTERTASFLLDVPTMNKYLPGYLITFGDRIKALEPPALRKRLREMAERTAALYKDEID